MKYRRLGKTELRVSVVGVGTWQFGGEWGKDFRQDEVDAMLRRAEELGINLIDTAECYGDHLSEQLIGRAVEGRRDRFILATKFGHTFNAPFERDTAYDPAAVRKQLDDSLRALRTDHVDLYQFHSGPDEAFDSPELWEMLHEQVAAGKVRHLGVSITSSGRQHQADGAGRVGAEALQILYNRLDRTAEEGMFAAAVRQGLGVLARVPLASGFLSGKYTHESTFPQNDVRGRWHREKERREAIDRVLKLQAEEVPPGVPMAQWALAWCLQHPAVACVIPGCKTVQQVESNAAAADLDMVSDEHPQAMA